MFVLNAIAAGLCADQTAPRRARRSLCCALGLGLCVGLLAQAQSAAGARELPARAPAPVASAAAASTTAPAARAAAKPAEAIEPSFANDEERSRFLSQTAEKIAILRQQQALVEAQVALAKAKADLASAGAAGTAASGGTVLNSGVLKKPGKAGYGSLELLGIQGTPKRRWANVAVGGGSVQQVEAGSVIAGWRVLEVRLGEILLEPLGQGGEPTLLRVEGSVERAPDGPGPQGRPVKAASKAGK